MKNLQDDRDSIVAKYSQTVWRLALSRTRSEDAAEEVYQETFMRLFQKERSFDSEEHRKAWLIRTTLICCKRYWSAAFRDETLSLEEVTDIACYPDEDKGVMEVLLRLPAKYRIPLQLYYVEGLEPDECAKVLNIRPVTFRVRISRGKAMLKEKLKGEGIYV
ncbi:MAG: sigma-70 family RNA polymerase sigma factor [Clostridia bacterium]|nr:sigma-70 family RNA polymerase sigma factor [Clostridia bacterium]